MTVPASTALEPIGSDPQLPSLSGPQLVDQIARYKELQRELDRALPDTLIDIGGNGYRTKEYWKAIALAFDVTIELIEEREHERGSFADGRPNFGYLVLMRASTRTGRSAVGDGACHAVEKAEGFRCPHHSDARRPTWADHYPADTCPDFDPSFAWRRVPEQATDHNVRANAFTRATNRAIANLVAFGEVSAEEMQRGPHDEPRSAATRPGVQAPRTVRVISEPQRKRLWVIGRQAGWTEDEVKALVKRRGFEHDADITSDVYDAICTDLAGGVEGRGER